MARSNHAKIVVMTIAVVTTLIGVIVVLELTNITHFFHTNSASFPNTPTRGGGSENNQKGESSSQQSGGSSIQPGDNKSTSGGASQAALITPTGEFVSNHTPGNGSPLLETSVCNTTPGATCQIQFIMGALIRRLPAQTTDRNGTTYWNDWTPQGIGLTSGTWQIQAIATLDGQATSASDATKLTVL